MLGEFLRPPVANDESDEPAPAARLTTMVVIQNYKGVKNFFQESYTEATDGRGVGVLVPDHRMCVQSLLAPVRRPAAGVDDLPGLAVQPRQTTAWPIPVDLSIDPAAPLGLSGIASLLAE